MAVTVIELGWRIPMRCAHPPHFSERGRPAGADCCSAPAGLPQLVPIGLARSL